MAHHKRTGPKSTRAGCLLCKPHKDQRIKKVPRANVRRRLQDRLSALADNSDSRVRLAHGCD